MSSHLDRIDMESITIESPDFCPMCQQNVQYKNVCFDYSMVPDDVFVPENMKRTYYCFKCFAGFMYENGDELQKFKLVKDKSSKSKVT